MSPPEKARSPDRTVPTEADATEVDSAPKRKAMTEEQAREVLGWFEGTGSQPVDENIAEILAMSPEERRSELLAAGYSSKEVAELDDALIDAPAEAFASTEALRAWVKARSGGG
jgi:hypothetical protein